MRHNHEGLMAVMLVIATAFMLTFLAVERAVERACERERLLTDTAVVRTLTIVEVEPDVKAR